MKNWKQMTKEEKRDAMKDIAKLLGYGKKWKEIAEYYSCNESTISDYFRNFRKNTENTEKSCEEVLQEEDTVEISEGVLLNLLNKVNTLELQLASVKTLNAEEASIEMLKDSEYKYFLYEKETGKLIRKSENIEDLFTGLTYTDIYGRSKTIQDQRTINSWISWAMEFFNDGQNETGVREGYIVRNSFKESFDVIQKDSSEDDETKIYKLLENPKFKEWMVNLIKETI